MKHERFIVKPGKKVHLTDYDPGFIGSYTDKEQAKPKLEEDIQQMTEYQDVLYAQGKYAVLIILQAMDAAGKDSIIKHVMSGVNPQGCDVYSFKAPSTEELKHDYLWRSNKALPARGKIGIFNRSYYEEVLVVRVHPEFLATENIPDSHNAKKMWPRRFEEINEFERYATNNGIAVLKFFLNVSKDEQKKRFLERIDTPEKNWKFSIHDVEERGHWDDYVRAYEDVFSNTSTEWAPWYIIPADNKWYTRVAVADVIVSKMKSLKMSYPTVSEAHKRELLRVKKILERE
ncbi:MAG TPA: polyphosphate kinase 2 family protein [Blastocatellia bacterium]|nr:polyphosphate kinase 2 family protein [Blastocatellia bacterium]